MQDTNTLRVFARHSRSAFTLVEILIALAIFSMLAGAIFISVTSVTTAGGALAVEQMQVRKLDAFVSWCRKGFRNLSARSEVIVRTRDSGASGRAVDLVLRNAPGAFSIGEFDALGGDLILSAVPDGKGTAVFSMARIPGGTGSLEIDRELSQAEWLPVLDGIKTLRWSFWNPTDQKFVEEWQEGQRPPEMIRLELALASGESLAATFRLPRIEEPRAEGESGRNPDGNPDENPGPNPPGPNPPGPNPPGPPPIRVEVPKVP